MRPEINTQEFESSTYPHRDSLFRAAMRMCGGDSETAEDMVQNTYLKAFLNFHRFKAGTNLRAWLFRILANNVISTFRHRKVAKEAPYPDGFEPDHAQAVAPSLDFEQVSDEIKQALEDLPHSYREVFLQAAMDDSTYGEIARRLGLPVGTVMSRLWRARRQLRRSLESREAVSLN